MSLYAVPGGRHPLLAGVDRASAALDDTADLDPAFLSPGEQAEHLRALDRLERKVAARKAAALAVSDQVAVEHGTRNAAAWLSWEQRVEPGRTAFVARLGERLTQRYPEAMRAWAAGDISTEHVAAVADSLDELPAELPGVDSLEERQQLVARAEAELVKYCADYRPKAVRRLGRRILEVVAPEAADEVEQGLLEAQERRAQRKVRLTFRSTGDGTTRITAEVPEMTADILRKAIEAYTNPRVSTSSTTGAIDLELSAEERRGQAFAALIEHLPTTELPLHGGSPVQIIATLAFDKLKAGLGAASLDTGQRLSASATRRLACAHGLLPAVLDGQGEVLDHGRKKRLFTAAQRRAHAIKYDTCQAEGCPVPVAWTEAHHRNERWADGGTTNQVDLASLCIGHHHKAHDPTYEQTWNEAGYVRFHRRT